ncbi:MAG: glycoside hydrolase family 43 protein [Calditrichaceae bacterium]
MKNNLKTYSLVFFLFVSVLVFSCHQNKDLQRQQFNNPILSGFYPDPSICKVGSDYYIVNSTFAYFPGIPVFHSKNLVSWELIGHVMDRPEQMDLDGLGVSRGIFAPDISYNAGIFYVTCTLVDAGGNFVVTSEAPEGPWSNPVFIPEINGIDPSLFFDENNKTYILYNSIPPDNKPLYQGHRTIRMYEFDKVNLKVVGEEKILVNGGTDLSKKPVWIEGPHLYKIDGYYYLMCAEGGTSVDHSEVIFRSKRIEGPYISYSGNPILTQRNLDPKRQHPVTCTGHADMVQLDSGNWWAVFLGCRPYSPADKNLFNTGRETFLAPVRWQNGWPVINPDSNEVQYQYQYPIPSEHKISQAPYGGNFKIRDDFDKDELGPDWIFLRTLHEKWYDLTTHPGYLNIQLRPETCSEKVNPSFIARRQQHLHGSATAAIKFSAKNEKEKAGLIIFQNESHYYYLCKSIENNDPVIQLYISKEQDTHQEILASVKDFETDDDNDLLFFRIEANGDVYNFYYSNDGIDWIIVKENVDASYLSTEKAGGFVGCMYALYATSSGLESDNSVLVDWFEYEGSDETNK